MNEDEAEQSIPDDLEAKSIDHITSIAKGAIGAIPFLGPLMTEVIFSRVPGLQQEREIKFARILEARLSEVEQFVQ